MSDNPIIPLPCQALWLYVIDISIIISDSATLFTLLYPFETEQEPTSADVDSDEEADLVLSLETETGLLTNQHTKGKNDGKLNWEIEIIDGAF